MHTDVIIVVLDYSQNFGHEQCKGPDQDLRALLSTTVGFHIISGHCKLHLSGALLASNSMYNKQPFTACSSPGPIPSITILQTCKIRDYNTEVT